MFEHLTTPDDPFLTTDLLALRQTQRSLLADALAWMQPSLFTRLPPAPVSRRVELVVRTVAIGLGDRVAPWVVRHGDYTAHSDARRLLLERPRGTTFGSDALDLLETSLTHAPGAARPTYTEGDVFADGATGALGLEREVQAWLAALFLAESVSEPDFLDSLLGRYEASA